MRSFTALAAAFAMLVGIVGQDAKPFTYKIGSTMTYTDQRMSANGDVSKETVTWKVTKADGDKVYVDAASPDAEATFIFSYTSGFFCWGHMNDGQEDTGLQVFKVGAKIGDTWGPVTDAPPNVSLTYVADEEVTVPAGKFSCKKIVLDAGGHLKVTFWFADKVGMVKALREVSLNGKDFMTQAAIDLQKFVEGK